MTADHSGDSYMVVKGLYTRVDGLGDRITIECNWCADTDSTFFTGRTSQMHNDDWLAAAIIHLTREHPERMKT